MVCGVLTPQPHKPPKIYKTEHQVVVHQLVTPIIDEMSHGSTGAPA
jgi:hypothetical protein